MWTIVENWKSENGRFMQIIVYKFNYNYDEVVKYNKDHLKIWKETYITMTPNKYEIYRELKEEQKMIEDFECECCGEVYRGDLRFTGYIIDKDNNKEEYKWHIYLM